MIPIDHRLAILLLDQWQLNHQLILDLMLINLYEPNPRPIQNRLPRRTRTKIKKKTNTDTSNLSWMSSAHSQSSLPSQPSKVSSGDHPPRSYSPLAKTTASAANASLTKTTASASKAPTVPQSSSHYYTSSEDESKSSDSTPEVITSSLQQDTLFKQAKVLMVKVNDEGVNIAEFQAYLGKCSFVPLDKSCFQSQSNPRNYKVICICGAPNRGKSSADKGLARFFKTTNVTTVSNKYFKWACEERNFTLLHWSNGGFRAGNDIDFSKMHQSITSVLYSTPGNHLVVLEGHRVFENQAIMDMADFLPPLRQPYDPAKLPNNLWSYTVNVSPRFFLQC